MPKDAAARSKATPPDQDGCWNCVFSTEKQGKELVVCQPDLPPMVNVSADPRRYMVHKNYRCIFHKLRT